MNEDGSCNTSIIETSVKEISEITNKRKLLVIKSTVPPGTTFMLQELYPKFDFLFNPEFLTQAKFIDDFLEQDRILIGYPKNCNVKNVHTLKVLYDLFLEKRAKIKKYEKINANVWVGNSNIAEMTKYVGNSFLATKVSFFNEMYEICKSAGIDYDTVTKLVSMDKRIGSSHMQVPGSDGKFGFSRGLLSKGHKWLNSLRKRAWSRSVSFGIRMVKKLISSRRLRMGKFGSSKRKI